MSYLSLIGSPQVQVAGRPWPWRTRRLLLLAYLALEGRQTRATLGALFFPALSSEEARARLRVELHRLHHSELGAWLHLQGDEVWLEVPCDLLEVRRLVAGGRFAEALELCRGPLLHHLEGDDLPELADWLRAVRQDYERLRSGAASQEILRLEGNGQREAALLLQRQMLLWQPYSEEACDALTDRLVALGRRAEALEEQEIFRQRFVQAFGWQPNLAAHRSLSPAPSRPVTAVSAVSSLSQPPLVGREGLLGQLAGWYGATPAGAVALLVGDGGVGKTRLAQAFAAGVGPAGTAVTLLRGRQSQRNQPLLAVQEALQGSRARLSTPACAPDDGRPGQGALSEARLLEDLARALRQRLPPQTRLVTIEDAQWLDASSARVLLALQAQLAVEAGGPRILLLARPEGLSAGTPLAEVLSRLPHEPEVTRLEVSPLSEISVLKLVRLLSGSPRATAFARTLHGLSGGNAFALLAFLQGLISRNLLDTSAPGGWQLHVELSALPQHLPVTLQSLLEQSILAAGQPVLILLQAAALLGRDFQWPAAAAGSGLERAEAHRALETALTHRWVRLKSDDMYLLEHDLLREALLRSLKPQPQAAMYARLAAYLEEAGGSLRQRAVCWEGAGERGRAFGLWQEAAQEALDVWAYGDALAALQHALDCTDEPAEKIRLWRERGRIHQLLGALDDWQRELDEAEALQARARVPGEDLRLALERVHLLQRSRRWQEALAVSQPWMDGPVHSAPEYGLLLRDHASVLVTLGQLDEAETLLRRGLRLFGPGEQPLLEANLLQSLASVAYYRQAPHQGLPLAAQAVSLFRQLERLAPAVITLLTQAELYLLLPDPSAARQTLGEGLELARRSRQYRPLYLVLGRLLELAEQEQDWQALTAYATEGLEAAEAETHLQGVAEFGAALDRLAARRAGQERPTPSGETQV